MRLHVHEWSGPAAPPVVCLHGVTAHGERYRRLAEERWTAFHVVAPDLRGHGRSGWEPPWTFPTHVADLVETTDALGLGRADWIGHSWGGRLVLELAAAHPERIRRAVLLDPAIQPLPGPSFQLAGAELNGGVYASAEAYVEQRLAASELTPREDVERDVEQAFDRQPDGTIRRRSCQPAVVSVFGELVTPPPPPETLLGAPTLLIYAPAFGLVRHEQVAAYREALGDGLEVLAVPGMHIVMWDAFDAVATAVERFLAA
jgi:lipase